MIEPWPKHRSGIRDGYENMPYIQALNTRWKALHTLVKLVGLRDNDLWKQKVPSKTIASLERQIKLKTNLLETDETLLKHESGCSLQYLIFIAEIMGAENWYENLLNRNMEAEIKSDYSRNKVDGLLGRLGNYKRESPGVCETTPANNQEQLRS